MKGKRIISILIAVVLLFTGCIQYPVSVCASGQEAKDLRLFHGVWVSPMRVESGKEFYFGDLVTVYVKDENFNQYYWAASELEASYVSDYPEVIELEEDGYARTKAPGEASVTVSCGGVTETFPVIVVEKGKLTTVSEEQAEKWDMACRKFAEKIPSEITVENGYDLLKALKAYVKACSEYPQKYKTLYGLDSYHERDLLSPCSVCFYKAEMMMDRYIYDHHPMYQKKYWVGKKDRPKFNVTAKTDKIVLKFRKKLDGEAILALYMAEALYEALDDYPVMSKGVPLKFEEGRMESHVYLEAIKSKDDLTAIAVFEEGSSIVTIKQSADTKIVNGTRKFVNKKKLKLKKGQKYKMYNRALASGGGYPKFTVK